MPFLDNRSKEVYERPFSHARIYDPEAETVPRVRVRCRREELYKFLHLLDSTDRLGLYPTSSIRKGLECGAFSVPKDGSRDRLILDARAPNQMEVAEDRWIRSLGSVQQFGHFFLAEAEELRMHTEDLREFYHSFLVGAERSKRNAFKVQLTKAEAKRFRCFEGGRAGAQTMSRPLARKRWRRSEDAMKKLDYQGMKVNQNPSLKSARSGESRSMAKPVLCGPA